MFDIALIDQCKNQNVPTEMIQQIIKVESNFNTFAINVNSKGKSVVTLYPKTKEKAKKIATSYIDQGFSVDLGLMQFNSNNLLLKSFAHLSLDEILDPCTNIKAGSDIFYNAYIATDKSLPNNTRIQKALSVYNTGNEKRGFENGYVAKYSSITPKTKSTTDEARYSSTKIELTFSSFNLNNFQNLQKNLKNYE